MTISTGKGRGGARKGAGRPKLVLEPIRVDVDPIAGEPFTVPHFKAWASELVLDNGDPWIVEDFFAAYLEDLFAGFTENWLVVPEGNTKTTSMAGLAVYHCEYTSYAWVPWAASSRDQAEIGYIQAEGFIERSERLSKLFKLHPGYRRIRCLATAGRMQIFAADDRTGDGVIPTLALVDEGHRHKDLALYRTWRGKTAKRGGQIALFSTSGAPGSEFEETREKIRRSATERMQEGSFLRVVSGSVCMHEWAVPDTDDVEDMDVVKAANPFSGITVDALREKFESPTTTLPHWRRFVCNLPTRVDEAAITEAEWCAAISNAEIPVGEPVDVGLDLGWKYDTTAIVPLWIRDREFRLFGPAVVLEPPMNGEMLDSRDIERAFVQLHKRNPVRMVVMDPHRGEQMHQWIRQELGAEVVERQQTIPLMALDYSRFMEALREGWIRHAGDEAFTRHVLNAIAKVLPRGDIIFERPAKSRNSVTEQRRRVVDALDAAAMVHSTVVAQWDEIAEEPYFAYA